MPKVSAIVCAYNEAERIANILSVLKNHPYIDEVIVVDDGSVDDTRAIVRKHDFVRLLTHDKNQGKSRAVMTGLEAARNDIVCFLDADLIGLVPEDVTQLLLPVLNGSADVTLSLRENSYRICHAVGFDYITGDRVFYKDLLEGYREEMKRISGYGIEVYINKRIIAKRMRVKSVLWKHVTNPSKLYKKKFKDGALQHIRMIVEILKVIPPWEVVRQHWELSKLMERPYTN